MIVLLHRVRFWYTHSKNMTTCLQANMLTPLDFISDQFRTPFIARSPRWMKIGTTTCRPQPMLFSCLLSYRVFSKSWSVDRNWRFWSIYYQIRNTPSYTPLDGRNLVTNISIVELHHAATNNDRIWSTKLEPVVGFTLTMRLISRSELVCRIVISLRSSNVWTIFPERCVVMR